MQQVISPRPEQEGWQLADDTFEGIFKQHPWILITIGRKCVPKCLCDNESTLLVWPDVNWANVTKNLWRHRASPVANASNSTGKPVLDTKFMGPTWGPSGASRTHWFIEVIIYVPRIFGLIARFKRKWERQNITDVMRVDVVWCDLANILVSAVTTRY